MLKRITISAIVSLSLLTPATASTFSSLYIFGDSLSTDGKAGSGPAPSDGGRFSNGPVFTEIIADRFADRGGFTANYALGGATANDVNLSPDIPQAAKDALGTFNDQITTFEFSGAAAAAGEHPLVSVLFGANDFFQQGALINPIDAAQDVISGVRRLSAIDKFDNFLVLNLPDLALIPANAGLDAAEAALLSGAVQLFNQSLATGLADLKQNENPALNFQVFDLFSAFGDALVNPRAPIQTTTGICTPRILDPNDFNICPTLESADAFFFVDAVHPNRVVHAQLAEEILASVAGIPPAVPLPAGLPLMLVGLGGFALLRRRAS